MNRSKTVIVGLLSIVAAVSVIWLRLPPARNLGSIVYSGRDGLCSIDYPSDMLSFCLNNSYDNPSFSPNGQLLAVVSDSTSWGGRASSRIVILNRSGGSIKSLAESDGFLRPVWSPDGN